MSRIGIFGGSFNPPHKAHRAIVRAVKEQYDLDTVYFLPSAKPPHKSNDEMVSDDHRFRMVRFLIDSMDDDDVKISDFELKKGGISYTHETLESWKNNYPGDELFFIMGGDSLETFDTWREPEKITKYATLLVVPRMGMSDSELEKLCKNRSKQFGGSFLPVKIKSKYSLISSTVIRKKFADGIDMPEGISRRVWRYIRLHGLYGCELLKYSKPPDHKELRWCLKSTLRPKRLKHTIGVAETAQMLGNLYSNGEATFAWRAELAGMLHDCAKYYSDNEQIALCDEYGIELTKTERENPSLIHAKLGAYLARERYGVNDEEILSAIRLHTVGKPDMTTLEKIIYISDYIEPGRDIPTALHPLKVIREKVRHDLDGALIDVVENTIEYLGNSGRVIDEGSLDTWKYYSQKKGQDYD
ncbi:MAG: nicotinate (nicotinamide) nucleotide adenylyltransferase [Eubacterium sp.]|nr:nicotinate (nicotinamide) nucleotide adenylyltransferase [Eubacterium sp.]